MKLGMGEMMKLAAMATQGPAALAPIVMEKMPGVARILLAQRLASIAAQQAATISRRCGDALAHSLANGQDVTPETIDALLQAAAGLVENAVAIGQMEVGVVPLMSAYGYGQPMPAPAQEIGHVG